MTADYRKVLGALCDEFFEGGSTDIDSIQINGDYREALRMLGCEVEENCKKDIETLSIGMRVDNVEIPSYDIKFAAHPYLLTHRDNPLRVETAISHAIEQYDKEINSELYITQDIAIVGINFGTEDDAKRFYELVTKEYSKLNDMWNFIYENL
ncbi:MAG: hypothetical protein KAS90_05050 [Candidatus Aenigmarchaeota archaeon]|nr:hypothetical protein [Candidatus Aenigmarchaeota archaeon]